MSDFDTVYNDQPVCPWCGHKNSTEDLYETTIFTCENEGCEKSVAVEIQYEPYYSTSKSYVHKTPDFQPGVYVSKYPCCNGWITSEHTYSQDPKRWTCPEAIR